MAEHTLETAREYVRLALEQFDKYPPQDGYESGHLGALHVIGTEALGMDLPPLDPPLPEKPKQVSHLRVVK